MDFLSHVECNLRGEKKGKEHKSRAGGSERFNVFSAFIAVFSLRRETSERKMRS
jgi:hypothetical protein